MDNGSKFWKCLIKLIDDPTQASNLGLDGWVAGLFLAGDGSLSEHT